MRIVLLFQALHLILFTIIQIKKIHVLVEKVKGWPKKIILSNDRKNPYSFIQKKT